MTHDGLILLAALGWAAAGAMLLIAAYLAIQVNRWEKVASGWRDMSDRWKQLYKARAGSDDAYQNLMKIVEQK
jgi:hypothetical protein